MIIDPWWHNCRFGVNPHLFAAGTERHCIVCHRLWAVTRNDRHGICGCGWEPIDPPH